ncbi:hypothetical protein ACIBG8_03520 [Nonomuraea sp. NPDC050556]|uniref:hypothetical protein n=1 Tax=Nonomuraea sp. NPDC050556 TaxID=3364369 RepID=UPI0037AD9A69
MSAAIYSGSDPVGGVDVPDEFKLSVNGAHDVVGFRATLYGSYDLPAGEDGTATLPFTPWRPGQYTLEVVTYDRAGNLSPAARHTFTVAKSPPDVPTGMTILVNQTPLTLPRPNCARGEDRPWYGPGAAYPTARFVNRDGGPIVARFQFQTLDGEAVEEKTTVPQYSGAYTSMEMTDKLQDGQIYRWRARGEDTVNEVNGEWSAWCEFGYDAVGPKQPPALSVSGESMTLGPDGNEGITGYFYGAPPGYPGTAIRHVEGREATVTLPPDEYVAVFAHDRAGNLSPVATYIRN